VVWEKTGGEVRSWDTTWWVLGREDALKIRFLGYRQEEEAINSRVEQKKNRDKKVCIWGRGDLFLAKNGVIGTRKRECS